MFIDMWYNKLGGDILGKFKHGKYGTRLYRTYASMKRRCYNKNVKDYKNYGGRGVRVCDEWTQDFMNFYNWAINNGYNDNLTIDRINVNGNYEPNNCRWITMKQQENNRRNNVNLTYNGITKTITQWGQSLNIPRSTIFNRYYNGWTTEDILFGKHKKK